MLNYVVISQVGSVTVAAKFSYEDSASAANLGHAVDFTFSVKNTGLLTLFDVYVHSAYLEGRDSTITCDTDAASDSIVIGSPAGSVSEMMPYPDGGLIPGRSIECTASVEVLQTEINARDLPVDVSTTAMYEGDVSDLSETTSASAETQVTLLQAPALQVEKTFSLPGESGVGESVDFSITVKNEGNVDLVDVALTDAMFQNDEGGYDLACGDGSISSLEVGASFRCLPQVTILQSNVDAGTMNNTARATAVTQLSTPVSGSANTTVTFTRVATLSFEAVVGTYLDYDATTGPSAGDTISYTFDVLNTGTTTLWSVKISSDLGGSPVCVPPLESLELAPGDKTECRSTYDVNQTNLDAGLVENFATVNATSSVGAATAEVEKDVKIERESSLIVAKTGTVDAGTDGAVNAGDVVSYLFEVENTGHTCLAITSIVDDNAGEVECPYVVDMAGEALFCPSEAFFTCTQTITITQDDMDAGSFSGNVTIAAVTPEGDDITASAPSTVSLKGASSVVLDMGVVLTPKDPEGYPIPGDIVVYTINITNEGSLTLHDVTPGSSQAIVWICDFVEGATLAPGARTKCVGQYVLTQNNLDDGQVVAVVNISATDAVDEPVREDLISTLELSTRSDLAVVVSVVGEAWIDDDGNGVCDPGEGIEYVLFVRNAGTVTLSDIQMSDDLLGDQADCGEAPKGGSLAPDAGMTCTGTYQIDQIDIDRGNVPNAAVADAVRPHGTPVNGSGAHLLSLPRSSAIDLVETCAFTGSDANRAEVGQGVAYSFEIKNTGSTTLTSIDVTSRFKDQARDGVACITPFADLARNKTVVCSSVADHVITQADIDAGEVSDTASVLSSSPAPSPQEVSADASCTAILPRQPGIEILKEVTDITAASGFDPAVTDAGDTFAYRITVSNAGNTWLSDVIVTDPLLDGGGCGSSYVGESARFAPGGQFECTAMLTLEQVHIDGRCVESTAEVRCATASLHKN